MLGIYGFDKKIGFFLHSVLKMTPVLLEANSSSFQNISYSFSDKFFIQTFKEHFNKNF